MTDFDRTGSSRWPFVIAGVLVLAIVGGLVFWLLRPGSFEGETVFDAGRVEVHAGENKILHEFVLKNIADKPLTVVGSSATCGCTEFIQPDDTVLPGENFVVPVTLSLEWSGRKTGGVVLRFDDNTTVNLIMKADADRVQPVGIAPRPMDLSQPLIRPIMDVEWRENQRPPKPKITTTNGVEAMASPWRLHAKAKPKIGQPAQWRSKLKFGTPDTPGQGTLTVQVGDTRPTSVDVIWKKGRSIGGSGASGPVDPGASPSTIRASERGEDQAD